MEKLKLKLKSENVDKQKIEENARILRNRLYELNIGKVEFEKKERKEETDRKKEIGRITKSPSTIEWATLIITFVGSLGGLPGIKDVFLNWRKINPEIDTDIELEFEIGDKKFLVKGKSYEEIKEEYDKIQNGFNEEH